MICADLRTRMEAETDPVILNALKFQYGADCVKVLFPFPSNRHLPSSKSMLFQHLFSVPVFFRTLSFYSESARSSFPLRGCSYSVQ